jgi:hypothetical protein
MRNERSMILATCLLLTTGCGSAPTVWQCNVKEESGVAVLEIEKLRVVFEGIKLTSNPGRAGGGASGSMQIAGSGTSKTTLTAFGQKLTSSYVSNINTIALGDFGLRITEGGRKLVVGNNSYDIGAGVQTIIIHPDGSAELQNTAK